MMDNYPCNSKEQGDGLFKGRQFGRDLDSKTNLELLDELDEYIECAGEEHLDAGIVEAYLNKLQEKAPIEEGDEAAARAKLPWHVADAPKKHKRRWLRAVAVGLAAILILGALAGAFGNQNPFLYIWERTEDVLLYRFHPSGELTIPEGVESQYHSLPEALDAVGFDVAAAPTWIPSDYVLTDILVRTDEKLERVTAYFEGKNRSFLIQISRATASGISVQIEKEKSDQVYEINGVTYEIFTNTKSIKAVWNTDQYLCTINGSISQSELQHMLKSIQTKEENVT